MRHSILLAVALAVMAAAAAPAGAATDKLEGPDPAIWLADPEGDLGDNGIEQGDPVAGASGKAKVRGDTATIKVKARGLVPGHTYTMWVVYFSDQTACIGGCNGPDLPLAGAGVIWADGEIAAPNGKATFSASLTTGDGGSDVGQPPPPPFAFAPFEAGPDNEFHVVIRSHGPQIPGQVTSQLTTFGGGCAVEVGPTPGQMGDFPVPVAPGECGDVQLYVFK